MVKKTFKYHSLYVWEGGNHIWATPYAQTIRGLVQCQKEYFKNPHANTVTHSLAHSLTQSLTHLLTHSLTHSPHYHFIVIEQG